MSSKTMKAFLTALVLMSMLALSAAVATVPASAGPRTCGHASFQYDSSGVPVGPYCH